MQDIIQNYSDEELTYALYGLFLGDGHYRRGRIIIKHTEKQKFYCEWLETLFKNRLTLHSRYDYEQNTTFGIRKYSSISLKVPDRLYFDDCNRCLNDDGKKIVSDYVLDHINEMGLLFWFLDDGCLHVSFKNHKAKRFAHLCTHSFTYDENVKIQQMFKRLFDIDVAIHTDRSGFKKHKDKIYYKLYFNADNFRKFFNLLRPLLSYIPEEFYYKFNMQYFPNRLKNSVMFSEMYNMPLKVV